VALRGRKGGRKGFEKLPLEERAIVFYAEDGGSWPHFEPIVRELTDAMNREICYLTSSADDPILQRDDPRINAYEIGEGFKRAFLFQTMEVGALVATVPQLGIKVLPRSRRAEALGTTYLYVFHSMVSTHMIYEPDGFDHYDTVFCAGPYMVDEIRRREELYGLPAKELVEHGYGRLDAIVATAALATGTGAAPRAASERPVVLIAPSWGPTCIFETCGAGVVRALLDADYEVIARPHPMTAKKTPKALAALSAEFASHPRFTLDTDIAAQASLHRSDIMVSDWSGAALEYAFGLERPVVFLDVPRKVNNSEYEKLGIEPFEAAVRERVGRVVAPDAIDTLADAIAELLRDPEAFRDVIRRTRTESIFNVGTSGRVAAKTIAAKADQFLTKLEGGR
jgi:CDP-Glycerol:Poly(glycerophosphate) glycerophosphotransferase